MVVWTFHRPGPSLIGVGIKSSLTSDPPSPGQLKKVDRFCSKTIPEMDPARPGPGFVGFGLRAYLERGSPGLGLLGDATCLAAITFSTK